MELVSLMIPAFNEEENIPVTIKALTGLLAKQNFDYEDILTFYFTDVVIG